MKAKEIYRRGQHSPKDEPQVDAYHSLSKVMQRSRHISQRSEKNKNVTSQITSQDGNQNPLNYLITLTEKIDQKLDSIEKRLKCLENALKNKKKNEN